MKTMKVITMFIGIIGTIYNFVQYQTVQEHLHNGDYLWLIMNGYAPSDVRINAVYAFIFFVVAIGGMIATVYHKE